MGQVAFNLDENKIHHMYVWSYAYKQARKSQWAMEAVDRFRFQRRIDAAGDALLGILNPSHRERIYIERFCDNINYNKSIT